MRKRLTESATDLRMQGLVGLLMGCDGGTGLRFLRKVRQLKSASPLHQPPASLVTHHSVLAFYFCIYSSHSHIHATRALSHQSHLELTSNYLSHHNFKSLLGGFFSSMGPATQPDPERIPDEVTPFTQSRRSCQTPSAQVTLQAVKTQQHTHCTKVGILRMSISANSF